MCSTLGELWGLTPLGQLKELATSVGVSYVHASPKTFQGVLAKWPHLRLARQLCRFHVTKQNFLAEQAKEGNVLFPGSVVTAKAKKGEELLRGIVKYATVWTNPSSSSSESTWDVAYELRPKISVKHSDVESILHRTPGDFSIVDAAVAS